MLPRVHYHKPLAKMVAQSSKYLVEKATSATTLQENRDNMCSKLFMATQVKNLKDIQDWKESYLSNLLLLRRFGNNNYRNQSSFMLLEKGITFINLNRTTRGILYVLAGLKMCDNLNSPLYLYNLANVFKELGNRGWAIECYDMCVNLMTKLNIKNPEFFKLCLSEKDSLLKEKRVETDVMNENMFSNFELFESKMSVIEFLLKQTQTESVGQSQFASSLARSWQEYNRVSTIVLSTIVTKSYDDFERSLNLVFSFLFKCQFSLLHRKLLSYTFIDTILNKNLQRFEDPLFGDSLTWSEIITKASIFNNTSEYFQYLKVYQECKLISLLKKVWNVDESNNTLLMVHLRKLTSNSFRILCFSIGKKPAGISSRLDERREYIYNANKKDANSLAAVSVKVLILAFKYYLTCWTLLQREQETITSSGRGMERNLKILYKPFVAIIPLFQSIRMNMSYEYCTYYMELILTYHSKNVPLNKKDPESSSVSIPDRFLLEKVSTELVNGLSTNPIDHVHNPIIIKQLLYCILLGGGYHITVVLYLLKLEQFFREKSDTSLISCSDGTNLFYPSFNSTYMKELSDQLDKVLEKVTKIKFCLDSTTHTQERGEENTFSTLFGKRGHLLMLPQVFLHNNRVIMLSEFGNVIADGENIRTNVIDKIRALMAQPEKLKNNCNSNNLDEIQGILVPTRESVFECLKKSDVLLKVLLGRKDIPLLSELDKVFGLGNIFEDTCKLQLPYNFKRTPCGECTQTLPTVPIFSAKEFDSNDLLQDQKIENTLLTFKQQTSVSERDNERDSHLWRMMKCSPWGSGASAKEVYAQFS